MIEGIRNEEGKGKLATQRKKNEEILCFME
jgi:hypothetical protein